MPQFDSGRALAGPMVIEAVGNGAANAPVEQGKEEHDPESHTDQPVGRAATAALQESISGQWTG